MLDMLKARKERDEQGFTLAELLIVVAIIAVLIAIAIPVFTTQLERSREATDLSNVRSAYAEAVAEYLSMGANTETSATASAQQKQPDWQMGESNAVLKTRVNGKEGTVSFSAKTTGEYTVHVDASGTVTVY